MVKHDPQWDSGYRFFPKLTVTSADNRYQLRPIHWNDRHAIRQWRNEQIEVLRQQNPLSVNDQDNYFSNIVLPQLAQDQPDQILFAFLENSQLVGYGGFVHIVWADRSAEVSFLTETYRSVGQDLFHDWLEYLNLLTQVGRQIELNQLTTETYVSRGPLIAFLENFGFSREIDVGDHHVLDGVQVSSVHHKYLFKKS
jgi:hypothetical protein